MNSMFAKQCTGIFLYLYFSSRMGSFTSAPKILNDDTADNDLHLPTSLTWEDLQMRCEEELSALPSKIVRKFQTVTCSSQGGCKTDDSRIRVMQWNILSQGENECIFINFPTDSSCKFFTMDSSCSEMFLDNLFNICKKAILNDQRACIIQDLISR